MSSDAPNPSQQSVQSTTGVEVAPRVERLLTWFKAKGGELSPDVQVIYSASSGFHCRAIRKLSSSVVAKCPLSLTLSHLNLESDQAIVPRIESSLAKIIGLVPNQVLTYLLLVEQKRAPNKDLQWDPYITCLPEPGSMTTPLWFDEADMQYLAGTSLALETNAKRQQLFKEWEGAIEAMKEHSLDSEIFTFEWFLWAATIISSRAFISTHIVPGKETFPILFPVVDILNHSPTAKVEWDFHPHQDFTLKLLSHDEIRPGDELYNNYAPKQNDELLLGYGFCVEDNPVEQFALKLQLPTPVEQAARRMQLFEPSNVPFGMDTSFLTSTSNDEPSYLRSKGHPFGRYENQISFFQGIPPPIIHTFFIKALMNLNMRPADAYTNGAPSPRITLEVLLTLAEAINQRSKTLPLTLATLPAPSNTKQHFAAIYRTSQARIIHAIGDELKAAIEDFKMTEDNAVAPRPSILNTSRAFARLATDFSTHAAQFRKALAEILDMDIAGPRRYAEEIASAEIQDAPAELFVWKLLLTVFAVLQQTPLGELADASESESAILRWTRNLTAQYPLPDEAEVEAAFLESLLPGEVQEEQKRLLERAYVWADEVVDRFAFPLVEGEGEEEVQRIYMMVE